jgi:hypothetical protein
MAQTWFKEARDLLGCFFEVIVEPIVSDSRNFPVRHVVISEIADGTAVRS